MRTLRLFLIATALIVTTFGSSRSQPVTDGDGDVGIGTTTPDASAVLDIFSTSKGLLLPRMETTERDDIGMPATGLVIYNTDSDFLEYNFGTPAAPVWTRLVTTAALPEMIEEFVWTREGNVGTDPWDGSTGDYIGTGDDVDLVFATGGVEQFRIYSPTNGGGLGFSGPLRPGGSPGTAGQVLISGGTGGPPTWESSLTLQDLTVNGIAQFSSQPTFPLAEGAMLVGNSADIAVPLPAGASGQLLQIGGGGTPTWTDVPLLPVGTTPNALLVWNGATWVENTGVTSDPGTGNTTIGGDLTVGGTSVTLPAGSVDNGELANSSVNLSYGTGLSGDASVSLGGTLNLQNTGVTSVTGTANQVNVSGSTGAVTLSLPQNIDANATPTFDGVTLDNLTTGSGATDVVVSNGGSLELRTANSLIGASTLTENSLWIGDAGNNPSELSAGTTGQVLRIDGSGAPVWQNVPLLPVGTTPNALLVWNGATWVENTNVTSDPGTGNTTIGGDLTIGGASVTLPAGSVDNGELANFSVNLSYGTGLSGDASVSLGGTLNLQNTGVTSVTGTANQVNVSGSTGAVTLSLPQNIDPNATPTFDGVTLDNLTTGSGATDVVVSNGGSLELRTANSLIGASTLTENSLWIGDAGNNPSELSAGTTGQVLRIDGSGAPVWQNVPLLPVGTTPNALLVWNGAMWVENTGVTSDPGTGNTTIGGDLTIGGASVTLPAGSVDNGELANSSVNLSYGTGLSGDASVSLGGTLNLQNTGVTSVTGTANQVNVSGSTGAVTLSLPQNIDANATPTFDGVTLDNLTTGSGATDVVVSNGGSLELRTVNSLIGASTLTENNLWVGDAGNNPSELAPGSEGQILTITGGVPTWTTGTPGSTDVSTGSTTDEAFAIRGTAAAGTSNQVIGLWGRATDGSAGNTGTIGVLASGNGNTNVGETNAALQVNDGEFTMGRTTETGTGYSVVESASGGTAYSSEGPSGVIEFNLSLANSSPLAGALVGVLNTLGTPLGAPTLGTTVNTALGLSVFNTTITVNNRYANTESIILPQVVDIADTDPVEDLITLFQNGTLNSTLTVTNRQNGSFDLTIDLRALGTIPAVNNGAIRVGYLVINPSR